MEEPTHISGPENTETRGRGPTDGSSGAAVTACRDGSPTLYSHRYRQHYHSPAGSLAESRHVFLQQGGVQQALRLHRPVHILEIGFGSGVNLLLLDELRRSLDSRSPVFYCAIEACTVTPDTVNAMQLDTHIPGSDFHGRLQTHLGQLQPGRNPVRWEDAFSLDIFVGRFEAFDDPGLQANFIFHDPFSVEANPELWTRQTFERLRRHAHPDAILSTYAAATRARAAMVKAGWHVVRGPGAPGKREMTLASPSAVVLQGYRRVNEQRLAERWDRGEFD